MEQNDAKAFYMECLSVELGEGRIRSIIDFFFPSANSYIRLMRQTEYHQRSEGWWHKLIEKYLKWKLGRFSVATGISIPPGTCDCGLTLYHHGSIVINQATQIGRNCCIMNNVNIGTNNGSDKAPRIGNNVYIGPGAVIFGNIEIADNCYIGANSVVCKSVMEPNAVIMGVPGQIIRYEQLFWWQKNKLNRI